MRKQFIQVLQNYLPENTAPAVSDLFIQHHVHLKIVAPRSSKLGDFRPGRGKNHHIITVNGDLNRYSFLITLLHELAHLEVWLEHHRKAKPHGKEWKSNFRKLLLPFVQRNVFPKNIERALKNYLSNPKASSCADPELYRQLKQHDEIPQTLLEDLDHGSIFMLNKKRIFQKGEKRRTRYQCLDIRNKKQYLISGIAAVEELEKSLIED